MADRLLVIYNNNLYPCRYLFKPGSYVLQMWMQYDFWSHKFARNNSNWLTCGESYKTFAAKTTFAAFAFAGIEPGFTPRWGKAINFKASCPRQNYHSNPYSFDSENQTCYKVSPHPNSSGSERDSSLNVPGALNWQCFPRWTTTVEGRNHINCSSEAYITLKLRWTKSWVDIVTSWDNQTHSWMAST